MGLSGPDRRAALLALGLALFPGAVHGRSEATATGAAAYEDMAVDLLRQYLRIDTTVPPGNELRGARFLNDVLAREGIPAEIDEFAPGRANLLAVLKSSGTRRPLILSHHIDVVAADAARWTVPPFSGALKDGLIYGRGAMDMKTEGILHLVALIRARREGLALDRDILFLATADEEADFAGALRALHGPWGERLRQAEYLITEGGENPVEGDGPPAYFGVALGEKGPLWLKLTVTGTPGHGSRPLADSALDRLVRALERIRVHKTEMIVLPQVESFLRDLSPRHTGRRKEWYADVRRALQDPAAAQALYEDREVSALLRNTVSITVVRAGYKTNVIPGTAEAELDVRLLPGQSDAAFLAELRRVIQDPTVEIGLLSEFRAPNASERETELFRTIEGILSRHFPGIPVTSTLLAGATESVLFRPSGVVAYGFTPLLATPDELASTHGDDERVREGTVRRSTGIFYEVVAELCRVR